MAGEEDALLKRAEESFAKRNYDYARDLFLTVLTKNPNSEAAHKGLFGTRVTKAKELGGKGKFAAMAGQTYLKGQLATVRNNPAKRVEICLKYLMDDPNNTMARTALASGYLDQSQWVAAAIEAQIAYSMDPKNVEAAKTMCLGLTKQGKTKEAQEILAKVASFAGDDRDIEKLQRELAAQQSAKVFDGKTDDFRNSVKNKDQAAQLEINTQMIKTEANFQEFLTHMQGQMEENPTDYKLPQKVAQTWFDFKKDYKTAKEWFGKASQLAPQDSVLRDKMEDCDLRIWDLAVETAEKAGDAEKLKEIRINRLKAFIASYLRRVADRPTDMALRFELGKAYFNGGQIDKAMGEFQQAAKDPKRKVLSHYYLGLAFGKKRMYDLADGQFTKSEEAGGGVLQQSLQLDIWYQRARVLAESGKKAKAIEFGSKIMEVDIGYKDISALMEGWTA